MCVDSACQNLIPWFGRVLQKVSIPHRRAHFLYTKDYQKDGEVTCLPADYMAYL